MRLTGRIWRRLTRISPPSTDPLVVFAIPLVSRRRSGDWDVVERNLSRTLASFRGQADGRWRALICGQDRPSGIEDDDRIEFLPYAGSDKFFDKGDKRVALLRHVSKTLQKDGYYLQFDADDILHPMAVEYMRQDNNGQGYYLDHGFMSDPDGETFAPLMPSSGEHPGTVAFNSICGSSNAMRFDFRHDRKFLPVLKAMRSHGRIVERMEYFGFSMQPIPFPAAIYVVGHGENMIERRGRLDGKLGYLQRHAIDDPVRIEEIRREFGLDELPPVSGSVRQGP